MPATAKPAPTQQDTEAALTEYTFKVEDFCYNRHTVSVRARDRDHASEKLQEAVPFPISCAWVPGEGERHP